MVTGGLRRHKVIMVGLGMFCRRLPVTGWRLEGFGVIEDIIFGAWLDNYKVDSVKKTWQVGDFCAILKLLQFDN